MARLHTSLNNNDTIFKDRRTATLKLGSNHKKCRRSSDFGKTETMPWWLKINYVSQHLHVIDPENHEK